MRYDDRAVFVTYGQGTYDPETGDYERDQATEVTVPASIMDTKTETMTMVYGELRKGSLTIQIQNSYDSAFDRIKVEEKLYRVDFSRCLKSKQIFIVSEVQ